MSNPDQPDQPGQPPAPSEASALAGAVFGSAAAALAFWAAAAGAGLARDARARRGPDGRYWVEVAAPSGIFLPCSKISELTRDQDLDRHHRQLVGNARKFNDRARKL